MAHAPGIGYSPVMTSVTAHEQHNPGDYEMVEATIDLLRARQLNQPVFAQIAAQLNVSEGHLRRLFRRWTGVTPKQFLQALTVESAKLRLDQSATLMDAALDVGLSGASRLHDHFVTLEAMTPADYRDRGAKLRICFGEVETPFGRACVAFTDRGICQLVFTNGAGGEHGEQRVRASFSAATLVRDDEAAARRIAPLWSSHASAQLKPRLPLLVKGTNFQVQVWRALLEIPAGSVADYGTVARQIGRPKATRAVASAIGANPVAMLIPCHRVIRRDGGLGGYHWGISRKQMLLVKERRPD